MSSVDCFGHENVEVLLIGGRRDGRRMNVRVGCREVIGIWPPQSCSDFTPDRVECLEHYRGDAQDDGDVFVFIKERPPAKNDGPPQHIPWPKCEDA